MKAYENRFSRVTSAFFSVVILLGVSAITSVGGTLLWREEEIVLLELKEKSTLNLVSWKSRAECSEWEGVECDVAGHVVSIDASILRSVPKMSLRSVPFLKPRSSISSPSQNLLKNEKSLTKASTNPRRSLKDSSPSTTSNFGGNSSNNQSSSREFNMALWNARQQVTTIVGTVPIRSRGGGKLKSKLGSQTSSLEKPFIAAADMNSAWTFKNEVDLFDCNVGFPPAQVIPGFEDSGFVSGIVSLRSWDSGANGWVLLCSGALIHTSYVLTAAHCVYKKETKTWLVSNSTPISVWARFNGGTDHRYTAVLATEATLFTEYIDLPNWEASLSHGCDIAILKLNRKIKSQVYGWTPPVQSALPRVNFGYPGLTQDGSNLIFDQGLIPLDLGCRQFSPSVLCESVSVEGGMSGGPLFSEYLGGYIVGVLSGAEKDACPAFFMGLTGTYKLATLVKKVNCRARKKTRNGVVTYFMSC